MFTRLLIASVIALMTTAAVADPPPGKGPGSRGGPTPPGHAYGLRGKQGAETERELRKIADERDRELRKIEEERDRELRKAEEERDRDLREADREGKDEKREKALEKYDEKREHILEKYDEKREHILEKYDEKREHILERGGSDDDDDRDDRDDRDDDDDDRDDRDDDDRDRDDRDDDDDDLDRRRTDPDDEGLKRDDDKKDVIAPGPRRPRDVRGDISDIEVDIEAEYKIHSRRIDALRKARRRAIELGNDEQVERIDLLIARENARHTERIRQLEKQRAELEQELERRRREETDKDEPDVIETPSDPDAPTSPEAPKKRPGDNKPIDREGPDRAPDAGDKPGTGDKPRTADKPGTGDKPDQEKAPIRKEIDEQIAAERQRSTKRLEKLQAERQQALILRDVNRVKEIDEQIEAERARSAEHLKKLERRRANAGARARERLADPEQAQAAIRPLRRQVAETDEDIQAEKRRHERRMAKLQKQSRGAKGPEVYTMGAEIKKESDQHAARMASLSNRRDRLQEKLAQARAAAKSVKAPAVPLDSNEDIRAMIERFEKELRGR